jgi:hypothetical protein
MANVAGPFGLMQIGTASGPPNFASGGNPPYKIASTYGTAIFFGDLVRTNYATPTGYLELWAEGDGATATRIPVGIFLGCTYYSTSQKKTVWNNYWPGSDATGDVSAHVCDDPNAEFLVQAAAGPIGQSALGQTADIIVGSGNTTTGISTAALDTPTTTSTLPFKVVGFRTSPPGANGSDITTAYNNVVVAFNNQMFKNSAGV